MRSLKILFITFFISAAAQSETTGLQFLTVGGSFTKIEDVQIVRRELFDVPNFKGQIQFADVLVTVNTQISSGKELSDFRLSTQLKLDSENRKVPQNPVHVLMLTQADLASLRAGDTSGVFVSGVKDETATFKISLVWGAINAFTSKDRTMKFYLGEESNDVPLFTALVNQKENKIVLKIKNPGEPEKTLP